VLSRGTGWQVRIKSLKKQKEQKALEKRRKSGTSNLKNKQTLLKANGERDPMTVLSPI
jgi:hypothetical protein